MIAIRSERAKDYTAIRKVVSLAFGRPDEAQLIEAIRASRDFIPELSLVAVEKDEVVGHVLLSPIAVQTTEGAVPVLALVPLAVHPRFQRRGIGSQLVAQGLEVAKNLGRKAVVVVGHPDFYPRFGFSSARARGLEAPFPVPDEAFMVLELAPGAMDGVGGTLKYPTEFADV